MSPLRAPSASALRLAPITSTVGVIGLGLWLAVPDRAPMVDGGLLAWVLLVIAFALCETAQVHVEVRRQTVSLSFSEIPLVFGLFLVPPLPLLLSGAVAALVVAALRRTVPFKVAFNMVVFLAEVAILELLFSLVAGPEQVGSRPEVWLACYVALVGASVLTGSLVSTAVVRLQGAMPRSDLVVVAVSLLGGSLLSTTVAVLVVVVVAAEPRAVPVLLVLLVAVLATYRAYDGLLSRHRTLALMHDFTATMGTAGQLDTLVSDALRHSRRLLSAEVAALVLVPKGAAAPRARVQRGEAERDLAGTGGTLVEQVLASDEPTLVARGPREAASAAWLARQGLRDAVVVPLRGTEAVVGALLVGDRMGEMGTFHVQDLQLMQTIAAHVEIALRSGHLVERLRQEATHDALTGLPNRTLFQERLEQAIAAPGQASGAVLLMDLDGFKDVNDTLGHHSGDQMLCEVAERLLATVPRDVTVARLGGDEFALLVPRRVDLPVSLTAPGASSGARQLAETLNRALRRPFSVEGVSLEIRASVGVALFPEHGQDGVTLLQRADVAMYAAKGDRAPLQVYDPELDQSSPRRLALISELRLGIEDDQLVCHYQPKVSLPSRTVIGVEALVRWQHPTMGLVPPDDFIPVAEHTGLIVPLTSVVLRTALQQCAAWLADGQALGVAVNVSPRGLLAADFVSEVAAVLVETRVPAQLLTLEITESSIMTDPKRATDVLSRLHDLGVMLSVDDFGTGYSSLAYLQRLPVDEVKIDKDFVVNLVTDASKAAIVRAIVDLGHTLGLRVVAEGVEDQRSLELLTDYGCDSAQGYLVSRPLAASAATGWLAEPVAWGRPAPARPRLVVSG